LEAVVRRVIIRRKLFARILQFDSVTPVQILAPVRQHPQHQSNICNNHDAYEEVPATLLLEGACCHGLCLE
jgi:hypothetical protein